MYGEHVIGPLERALTGVDDDTYLATLDAVALDIARSYDEGVLTFWDADQLVNLLWDHMAFSPRDLPFADVTTAVYEAFDAGVHHHGDDLDPETTYTEPAIRRILDANAP